MSRSVSQIFTREERAQKDHETQNKPQRSFLYKGPYFNQNSE